MHQLFRIKAPGGGPGLGDFSNKKSELKLLILLEFSSPKPVAKKLYERLK